ncbi:ABC transporter ATP-binding protein [Cryptosporangium phraense]|uniref:Spermidine/putrescine import ATP-binding protein PotA n=1 Tax=Cryptosporangium phraense TaxID=2593070 RepID=A0A545AU81_9ACTN|nr:ABC transporter ATP-binding protein [Cryptosporangium phraense]
MSPAIELVGVEKSFGKTDAVAAVRGVDLTIADGEFFSLLGPSGCGKSTTLRMIAGFEDPTAGQIRLHGADVTDVPPHKRDVNMVFQNYALFPHLNVRDNIAFGLRRKKVRRAELDRRVGEIIDVVQLTGRERRMPRELSGGQQQRVALARALVNRPRALLLDEPLGALDLQLRQNMQIELKRIQREVGVTFVYVTHDQSEALTMSDRVAVMNNGLVEQCADPKSVYESPDTPFVAQFIGTSNLFSAPSTALAGDELVLDLNADERLLVPAPAGHAVGSPVTFTVRPEKITVLKDAPVVGSRLRGTVEEIVYLGVSTSYVVRTALLENVVVFEKNGPDSSLLSRGDAVWLTWPTENAHTFNPPETRHA